MHATAQVGPRGHAEEMAMFRSPHNPEAAPSPNGEMAGLHVAVIHTPSSINLVAVAASRAVVLEQIAEYVRDQAGLQLGSAEKSVLHGLLAADEVEPAIRFYFERGGRWEQEWLEYRLIPDPT